MLLYLIKNRLRDAIEHGQMRSLPRASLAFDCSGCVIITIGVGYLAHLPI
jgi:hypothetical protein